MMQGTLLRKTESPVSVSASDEYTPEQYKKLKCKIDRHLLPLMWLCFGLQAADKAVLGIMAIFGLREDTGLIGQQYSWLTTVFYLAYMCSEFPSNFILQRWSMGKTLYVYLLASGCHLIPSSAKDFRHLVALRALQGFFESCINPGFILIIGSWYTRQEQSSRILIFQSAASGFGIMTLLALYGIGTLGSEGKDIQTWRYMSYLLGPLTIAVGILCLYGLGTPSNFPWLSIEEKRMANTRILENQSGHDKTGTMVWKWYQVRECLVDSCVWTFGRFYFSGLNTLLTGVAAFGNIINASFGFSAYLSVESWCLVMSKWKNLQLYIMALATVPGIVGFLGVALIETKESTKWTKWGMFCMIMPAALSPIMGWTLIPSNVAGSTKRTVTSSFTFVCACVGSMCGSQIFKAKDAPAYTPGVIGCSICFGIDLLIIVMWRMTLALRNKRRDVVQRLTKEEKEAQGRSNGESDMTDFENPHTDAYRERQFRYML
ncbi:major facilitator superfamily domain-containing protein [Armillaria novae-zelandiae]|uniref:Major facilitator superfamily domain-containing protein n=1 Tax=Armillaria novae-zelandiae TaxID=153914 RepID=A0AA39NN38_9AGAR|nr:major facilitator superfamily domain-containing protein [Armillaria novae-zelandiae]